MTQAVTAIQYTLANQISSGTNQGSWADVSSGFTSGCNYIGTFFYYADLGNSLGLMKDSNWFTTSSQTAALRTDMQNLKPQIQLGLSWLFNHNGFTSDAGLMGKGDTNRAAAANEGAVLVSHWLGNQAELNTGLQMLNDIETAQVSTGANAGTFMENTCFDTSTVGRFYYLGKK